MKSLSVTIQMKATEQYFPVVLFIMLFKEIISFESVFSIYNHELRPKTDAIRQCFTDRGIFHKTTGKQNRKKCQHIVNNRFSLSGFHTRLALTLMFTYH